LTRSSARLPIMAVQRRRTPWVSEARRSMGGKPGCPWYDQRGVSRSVDGDGDWIRECDIGAYEAPEKPFDPAEELTRTNTINVLVLNFIPVGNSLERTVVLDGEQVNRIYNGEATYDWVESGQGNASNPLKSQSRAQLENWPSRVHC